MFNHQIIKSLMDRYGHLDTEKKVREAMRRDGFGDMVDMLGDEEVTAFYEEHADEIKQSLRNYHGSGSIQQEDGEEECVSTPLDVEGAFNFDPQKCVTSCDGRCCKKRGYLMISYADIFSILSSPATRSMNIHSTRDLFESEPPLIDAFMNEKYNIYLNYIRFLPVGAEPGTPPEEAPDNVCPFLRPMEEVYSFHGSKPAPGTCEEAMGCILAEKKPLICRLSPVGESRGMTTGHLSYEYTSPAKECPGIETDVEIPLKAYTSAIMSGAEKKARGSFHTILMAHNGRVDAGHGQKRFNSVLLEFYNIDRLLALNGKTPTSRPGYDRLVEILRTAARGDYSLYDEFIASMAPGNKTVAPDKTVTPDLETEFFQRITSAISGMRYSIEPFLEASKGINIYGKYYEFKDFYFCDWEKQRAEEAKGLCQHLSSITFLFLENLVVSGRKFSDLYDVYYASGVKESKFFNWRAGNHICVVFFKKGDTEKGWIVDPSLATFMELRKERNTYENSVRGDEVYTTNPEHRYFVPAEIGSDIRKTLEVKANAQTSFSSDLDSFVPLFIYKNESLILAKFEKAGDGLKVRYFEQARNCDASHIKPLRDHGLKFGRSGEYSRVFSLIDGLLTKVKVLESPDADGSQRLVSSELEGDYMDILFKIELAVVRTYRENPALTDRIVSKVLKCLICRKEEKLYSVEYLRPRDDELHNRLLERIKSANLESECPGKILLNALKQVMDSVDGFLKKGGAGDAYLKFVTGYFKGAQ